MAEEGAPHSTPGYCYVIQRIDGTSQFFTSRDLPVVLSGLPGDMGADDPQEFTPKQIRHGSVKGGDKFETQTTTITVTTEDDTLRRYLLTAAAIKLKAWVIRVNADGLAGVIDYGENAVVVQSGVLGKFGFKGQTIQVELTPEPFFVEGGIPRFYFGRSCQHALYGPGCGVAKADYAWDTTVEALDPVQRILTLTGQRADTVETFFNAGHLFIPSLNVRLSIGYSSFSGDDTALKLALWHPELEVGLSLTAQAGCLHTVAACGGFANVANFGGFPKVPNKNPVQGL